MHLGVAATARHSNGPAKRYRHQMIERTLHAHPEPWNMDWKKQKLQYYH